VEGLNPVLLQCAPWLSSGFAVKNRIKATANVAKLTGVMKLVASAKLKAAEDTLKAAKPFGASLLASMSTKEVFATDEDTGVDELPPVPGQKRLIMVLTTDRGLCGPVNSSLGRASMKYVHELQAAGEDVSLIVCGEKGRVSIAREFADNTVLAIDSAFDKDPIFELASAVAERAVSREFDTLTLMFNEFFSAAKFNNVRCHFPQLAGLPVGVMPERFADYDVEPENTEETLVNLMEYGVGGSFFYAMLESQACEISQRVTAMDNASTNAGDMVDRFTLIYNRARQAKITTELTEIISGSESLES
jgi:ATP synthase F1 gamma subunit